jgi:hypothetical protein
MVQTSAADESPQLKISHYVLSDKTAAYANQNGISSSNSSVAVDAAF